MQYCPESVSHINIGGLLDGELVSGLGQLAFTSVRRGIVDLLYFVRAARRYREFRTLDRLQEF